MQDKKKLGIHRVPPAEPAAVNIGEQQRANGRADMLCMEARGLQDEPIKPATSTKA